MCSGVCPGVCMNWIDEVADADPLAVVRLVVRVSKIRPGPARVWAPIARSSREPHTKSAWMWVSNE